MIIKDKQYYKEYYAKHKDRMKFLSKRWAQNNKERVKQNFHDWYLEHKQNIKNNTKKWHTKSRKGAIERYGGKCNCCGESTYEFLTFDHVNNDGAGHRDKIGGTAIHVWIKRNNYPSNIQILCWNCNLAKANYGHCPHLTKGV